MLLDKTILIKKPNGISCKYYKDLGYDITLSEILIDIKDLSKNSKLKVRVKCEYCGDEKSITFGDYNKITKNKTTKYACSKCGKFKYKEACIEKYGVENYFQTEEFKNNLKNTNIQKYGVEYHTQSDTIKDKIKESVKSKYGVDNISQLETIKSKVKKTNLQKYGFISPRHDFKIDNHVNHIRYVENSLHVFQCEKGHLFEISNSIFYGRLRNNTTLCTICFPISENRSIKEKELFDYIYSIDNTSVKSYKDQYEIDIYIPNMKLGFEFNGIHWHSDKFVDQFYHLNKTNFFKEKGIQIIHIWEDDWIYKKDIIKSIILNKIGKTPNKIYARNCKIQKIENAKIVKEFLNENHIQGYVNSKIKLGIFHKDELVGLMTFDQFEGRKKMSNDEYNLNRFCCKKNLNIIGGASKLLNYFIKNYNPSRIVSYADKDWSNGKLYENLGFTLSNELNPDYKYLIKDRRVHKSKFRKSLTGISESKLEIPKIWDCGKLKFELNIIKQIQDANSSKL